jgi:hypothetical protein
MNLAQMNKLAQAASIESQCAFCGRPWFGFVAYCPYCGREHSFTKIDQEPDESPRSDEPRTEPRGPLGEEPRKKPRKPLPVKAAIAAVSALLLLWIVVKAPAPKADEGASPHAISASSIPSPGAGPPASAAQVPSVQVPAVQAPSVQARSIPQRTEASVPPPSNRSLCSVASETAGLCKSQE